jgi:hypothetical protein
MTEGTLAGHLAILEALVLSVAEQCLAASIKDTERLAVAFAAINTALVARAAEISEAMEDMRGADQAASAYGAHLAYELRAKLAKRVTAFMGAPVEGNA